MLFSSNSVYCQTASTIWTTALSIQAKFNYDSTSTTIPPFIQSVFTEFGITSYKQVLSFAKNPELQNVYQITLTGNPDNLSVRLNTNYSTDYKDANTRKTPIVTYTPNDYLYTTGYTWATPYNKQWDLPKIQADLAWDYTISNSCISIGIIDQDFDLAHPDLANKISPSYDPLNGVQHNPNQVDGGHGTNVACLAAGQTDGGGQLASVGFNTRIVAYTLGDMYGNDAMEKALHASTVMGVNVLSISWFYGCYADGVSAHDIAIIKEILDNGTVIVASAGNGNQHCGGQEIFPFANSIDSRIIKVTSTDYNDNHTFYDALGNNITDSHYPQVDICAPSYTTLMAAETISGTWWPYIEAVGHTSQATPIVAGVAALIKAVNPCLQPQDIEAFMKANTDPVADASSYPGLLGAGRINAYKAVQAAYYMKNAACNNNTVLSINYTVTLPSPTTYVASGYIQASSQVAMNNVSYLSGDEIDLQPGFYTAANITEFNAIVGSMYTCCTSTGAESPCAGDARLSNKPEDQKQQAITTNTTSMLIYPNPATDAVKINFSLQNKSIVSIKIYNSYSNLVKTLLSNENYDSGSFTISWTPENNLSSGMYYCVLETSDKKNSEKIILIR